MNDSIPQNTKYCPRCNTVKPLKDFYQLGTRGGRQKGYDHTCKKCTKEQAWGAQVNGKYRSAHLQRAYGITGDEYEALWQTQGGRCAACHRPEKETQEPNFPYYRRLAVDHCHKTGIIRGLLCSTCNQTFGAMGESPERIRGLLAYAEKWQQ